MFTKKIENPRDKMLHLRNIVQKILVENIIPTITK